MIVPASLTPDLARWQVGALHHELPCPFWQAIDPGACTCRARPLVDFLLALGRS